MAFFDLLKQTITGRPINITEPTFIRDECSAQAQVDRLKELIKTAPPTIAKQITQDIKMLSYGIDGENNVAYELKHSFMPILILRDLYLEYKGMTAQIDFVVIDTKFILIIECKKMTGDIEVTEGGDFIRLFKNSEGKIYKREGIYSPVVQNQRHLELIKHILCDEMDSLNPRKCADVLRSIVVFANPKTIVNMKRASADVKKATIRCDQLIAHMKKLHTLNEDGCWFPEEGMYRVARILMAHHKENKVDYTQKYGLTDQMIVAESGGDQSPQTLQASSVPIEETAIYKELREYRLIQSRMEGVKPYYIYSNAQLEEIIARMPESYEELKQIKGFGDVKCSKYGDAIIKVVKKFKSPHRNGDCL
jgi:hypothetical protein